MIEITKRKKKQQCGKWMMQPCMQRRWCATMQQNKHGDCKRQNCDSVEYLEIRTLNPNTLCIIYRKQDILNFQICTSWIVESHVYQSVGSNTFEQLL